MIKRFIQNNIRDVNVPRTITGTNHSGYSRTRAKIDLSIKSDDKCKASGIEYTCSDSINFWLRSKNKSRLGG